MKRHNKKGLNFNMLIAIAVFAVVLVMVTSITFEKIKVKNRPLGTAQSAILLVATHTDEALIYLDAAADLAGRETTTEFRQQGGLLRDYETNEFLCGEILNSSYWVKNNQSCIPNFEEILIKMFQGFLFPYLESHPNYNFPTIGLITQAMTRNTTQFSSIPGTIMSVPFKGGGEDGFSLVGKSLFTPDYPGATVLQTLNYGSRSGKDVQHIVLHYGAGWTMESDVQALTRKGASYHYIIDKDGQVYQYVPEDESAQHAGCTEDKGPNCKGGYNQISIGIAFVNRGGAFSGCQSGFNSCYTDANGKNWEDYTQAQIDSFTALVADITARHEGLLEDGKLKQDALIGHSFVDPDNKVDPGPAFEEKRSVIERNIIDEIAARPEIIPLSESEQAPEQQENNPLPGKGYTGKKIGYDVQQQVEQYDDYTNLYGEKYDLDPALIKAFITHESRGVADAKSPTGALGLMQLITSYHHETRCVPECGFSEEVLEEEYFNPGMNICCGASLIADLAKKKSIEWNCCGQQFDKDICINTVYDQPYEIAARRYNTAKCEQWADPDFVESIMGLYKFYGGNPAQFRSESNGEYRATYDAAIGFTEEIPVDLQSYQLIASLATNISKTCHDNIIACVEQELESFNTKYPTNQLGLDCDENAFLQSFVQQYASCLERPEGWPCTLALEGVPPYPFFIKINESGLWELHNENDKYNQRLLITRLVLPVQDANNVFINGGIENHTITFGFDPEGEDTLVDTWYDNKYEERSVNRKISLQEKYFTFSKEGEQMVYYHEQKEGITAAHEDILFCEKQSTGNGLTFALDLEEKIPLPVKNVVINYDETLNTYEIKWSPVTRYDDGILIEDIERYEIYCSKESLPEKEALQEHYLTATITRNDKGLFPAERYEQQRSMSLLIKTCAGEAIDETPANIVILAIDNASTYSLDYTIQSASPDALAALGIPEITFPIPLSERANEHVEPALGEAGLPTDMLPEDLQPLLPLLQRYFFPASSFLDITGMFTGG